MVQQQVDETILNNMGSLDGLLSERGYTTAVVPMNGEAVVRNEADTGVPGAQGANGHVTPGVVPNGYGAVAPQQPVPAQPVQQQPQVSVEQYHAAMAYAARMQAAAQEAAREKIEADDKLFLAQLDAQGLSEAEQNAAILYRHNQQLQAANQGLNETLQQQQARAEQEEQEEAKHGVAMVLALRNGLPWENPGVQAALLSAPDRQTMDQIVNGLRMALPQRQGAQPQTPAQVAANQLVGAPGRGSSAAAPAGPKPGSGDISGLLKSRPYQAGGYD